MIISFKNKTPGTCLSMNILVMIAFICAAPICANAQDSQGTQEPQQSTQTTPPSQQTTQPRQDNYFGTTNEGIIMEKDPTSGDNIIQVTPPPKPEQESQQDTTIIVSPEVNLPSQPRQKKRKHN